LGKAEAAGGWSRAEVVGGGEGLKQSTSALEVRGGDNAEGMGRRGDGAEGMRRRGGGSVGCVVHGAGAGAGCVMRGAGAGCGSE
jgi:hypothetical protein